MIKVTINTLNDQGTKTLVVLINGLGMVHNQYRLLTKVTFGVSVKC